MKDLRLGTLAAALVLLAATAAAQSLVPAGSINGAVSGKPAAVVTHDEPAVMQYAKAIRDRFFAKATIYGEKDLPASFAGTSLLVYATPAHPWFEAHRKELPFTFGDGVVAIDGREFRGRRLRVITAMRNPDDAAQRVVLYAAAATQDLVGINNVFHGPTEWLVADGDSVLASGSYVQSVTLAPAALQQDLETLVQMIKDVHPAAREGLPAPVAEAAAAAKAQFEKPLDRGSCARLLARVLVPLHDAHTALALPRSGEAIALPFAWLAEGLVVTADAGDLRRGDAIEALAGRDSGELMALLGAHVPAENQNWLRLQAPGLLTDLGMLRFFGLCEKAPVAVRIERDGKRIDVEVGPGPVPGRRDKTLPWARHEIDAKHSLGVFTLDRCTVDETYREALDAFFAAVREAKVTRVAVDLRANSGGNSGVVDEFLRYIDVESYASFSGDVRWSAAALQQRKEPGKVRFEAAKANRKRNVRVEAPFAGELFVLTGPNTFSSGNWFAVVVQDNHLGKVVGEATGNAPSSFGDILSFTLPNSSLGYTVSFKRWIRPDPARDPASCLEPDVAVPRTRQSVRDGTDPVLEWLRR
jgi:C-terminal processing protease CtpA/Prc